MNLNVKTVTQSKSPISESYYHHHYYWMGKNEREENPQSNNLKVLINWVCLLHVWGFPGGTSGKEPTCQRRRQKRQAFDPRVGKIPWRRAWQSIPVFLPGESHGERNLAGYSPWDGKESDTTEWLTFSTFTFTFRENFLDSALYNTNLPQDII